MMCCGIITVVAVPSAPPYQSQCTLSLIDLQKSRSSKGRKNSTVSPTHTKLQHRCTSEYQLNASDSNSTNSHSHYGTLSNCRTLGSSVQCMNHNGKMWSLSSGYGNGINDKTASQELVKNASSDAIKINVSQLRNFFENLNKEDTIRETSSSGAMKRGGCGRHGCGQGECA